MTTFYSLAPEAQAGALERLAEDALAAWFHARVTAG